MPDDPRLAELLAALDMAPDELHSDITPAVVALSELGWAAAPALLIRMLVTTAETRLHAQRAFEGILMRELGFVPGRGFRDSAGEARFRQLWAEHGDYAYDAPAELRARAVAAWQAWLEENGHG